MHRPRAALVDEKVPKSKPPITKVVGQGTVPPPSSSAASTPSTIVSAPQSTSDELQEEVEFL